MECPILKQGNAQGPETARSFLENVFSPGASATRSPDKQHFGMLASRRA
jgi:hypothetical protein